VRIAVSRSGGVAGMVRRAELDTDACEDADTWLVLAERARPLPPQPPPDRVRDAFVWTIEVGDEHTVVPDGHLTGPLRDLAERALERER
jgi:hypothetical protein